MSSNAGMSHKTFFRNVLNKDPGYKKALAKYANKTSIARILTQIRVQAKLTQSEVAQRAGWRKSYVSRLESPVGGVPDATTLTRFAEACGLSTAVVFGKENNNNTMHVLAGTTVKNHIDDEEDLPFEVPEQELELS